MKIIRVELEPGDDIEIAFKGLFASLNIEVSYSDGAIRIHRDGNRQGDGRIHDIYQLSPRKTES